MSFLAEELMKKLFLAAFFVFVFFVSCSNNNKDNIYGDFEDVGAHVLHLAQAGSYAPNAWGLKDMHGNAAEWTSSSWKGSYSASGEDSGLKVVRGGSWYRRQMLAASAARWRYPAWMRPFDVGFRVVVEE